LWRPERGRRAQAGPAQIFSKRACPAQPPPTSGDEFAYGFEIAGFSGLPHQVTEQRVGPVGASLPAFAGPRQLESLAETPLINSLKNALGDALRLDETAVLAGARQDRNQVIFARRDFNGLPEIDQGGLDISE